MDSESVWTFDKLVPGVTVGAERQVVSQDLLSRWYELYGVSPLDAQEVPMGLVSVFSMQAFMNIVAPRPPGNIHVGQEFKIIRLPKPGGYFTNRISCVDKFKRKERRVVQLQASAVCEESRDKLFDARMTIFWAA